MHPSEVSQAVLLELSCQVVVAVQEGGVVTVLAVNSHPSDGVSQASPLVLTAQVGTEQVVFSVSYVQPATAHLSELSVVAHFAVHAGWVFAAAVNEQPSSGSHPVLPELMEQEIDAVHVASFPAVHWHEPVQDDSVVIEEQSSQVENIIIVKNISKIY